MVPGAFRRTARWHRQYIDRASKIRTGRVTLKDRSESVADSRFGNLNRVAMATKTMRDAKYKVTFSFVMAQAPHAADHGKGGAAEVCRAAFARAQGPGIR